MIMQIGEVRTAAVHMFVFPPHLAGAEITPTIA